VELTNDKKQQPDENNSPDKQASSEEYEYVYRYQKALFLEKDGFIRISSTISTEAI